MCGIVGYVGPNKAVPFIMEGLAKLEYRGYDSAGVAVLENGSIEIRKTEGRLKKLADILEHETLGATTGIGHTRWATHGRPSNRNAHPHSDCTGNFALVHNGIIENFTSIKEGLLERGHKFTSETDTEVVVHLIEEFYKGDLVRAVQDTVAEVRGSYALVVVSCLHPDMIVCARKDSPLVIGLGEGENYVASDIPAVLRHTRRTYVLEDGEMAVLRSGGVDVMTTTGRPVSKNVFNVTWDPVQAERGGYPHFMLTEIHEQPRAIRDTLRGRISEDRTRVVLDEVHLTRDELAGLRGLAITACGTAYHAGMVTKYLIERLARIPVEIDVASEFRYKDPLVGPDWPLVVISQSGETADTLASLREGKRRGAHVIGITNVVGSSVAREASDVVYTWAGPEIAVASTKAYVTQLVVGSLLAIWIAQAKGTISQDLAHELISELNELPEKAQRVLEMEDEVKAVAKFVAEWDDAFFIGRGLDFMLCLEGQLKLKEISYIHAEGYPAGELKHGTLALITEGVPVIALATQLDLLDKTISNITEVKARGGHVTGVTMENGRELEKHLDHILCLPRTHQYLAPVLAVIPLQLLSYYAAIERGADVDKPRNLAKSVTVE
ncbi:MAG: glutamine--fructose-6-phosphate transaminase (isomerizing) [Bacillota bacterium]|nr:glutamine--fructose-6-phosphate transaminase (isomerizing) [Bacillota bacterium]